MDVAQCRSVVASMQANGPFSASPARDPYLAQIFDSVAVLGNTFAAPSFYDCMEARGWQFEAYE
jgi:hypothetical protein